MKHGPLIKRYRTTSAEGPVVFVGLTILRMESRDYIISKIDRENAFRVANYVKVAEEVEALDECSGLDEKTSSEEWVVCSVVSVVWGKEHASVGKRTCSRLS